MISEVYKSAYQQGYSDAMRDFRKKSKTDVLDKIRAEFISLYPKNYAGEPELGGSSCEFSLNKVLNVIDKYKAESKDKEFKQESINIKVMKIDDKCQECKKDWTKCGRCPVTIKWIKEHKVRDKE